MADKGKQAGQNETRGKGDDLKNRSPQGGSKSDRGRSESDRTRSERSESDGARSDSDRMRNESPHTSPDDDVWFG